MYHAQNLAGLGKLHNTKLPTLYNFHKFFFLLDLLPITCYHVPQDECSTGYTKHV
jgi:hypothetical protein